MSIGYCPSIFQQSIIRVIIAHLISQSIEAIDLEHKLFWILKVSLLTQNSQRYLLSIQCSYLNCFHFILFFVEFGSGHFEFFFDCELLGVKIIGVAFVIDEWSGNVKE